MSIHPEYILRPVLVIGFLQVFYGALRTNWPTNYYSTSDVVAGAIAPSVLRYSMFRFFPVFAVTLCGLTGLQNDISGRLLVATAIAIGHATFTIGRTLLHPSDNLVSRGSTLLAHAGVVVGIVVSCIGAVVSQPYLVQVLPDGAKFVEALVTAVFVTTLGISALKLTQNRGRAVAAATTLASVSSVRKDVVKLAAEYDIDYRVALAVIATELQQRPGWIRFLERAFRWTGLVHTFGISQSMRRSPSNLEQDLRAALEPLRNCNFRDVDHGIRRYQVLPYLEIHNDSPTFVDFAHEAFKVFSQESQSCHYIGIDGSPALTCHRQIRIRNKWILSGTISDDVQRLVVKASGHSRSDVIDEVSIEGSHLRRRWSVEVPLQLPYIEVRAVARQHGIPQTDLKVSSTPGI